MDAHALALLLEDGIHGEQVEVNVKVEAASESLRKRDRSGRGAVHAREALGHPRDLAGEDAAEGGQNVRLGGREAAEFEGERENPLA